MRNKFKRTPKQNRISGVILMIVGIVFFIAQMFADGYGPGLGVGVMFLILGIYYFQKSMAEDFEKDN